MNDAGPDTGPDAGPDAGGAEVPLWVDAAIDQDEGAPYVCRVQLGDTVLLLSRVAAVRYGMAVLQVAWHAHYLAAVWAQMAEIAAGSDDVDELCAVAVREMIERIKAPAEEATGPLRFRPTFTRDRTPQVALTVSPHEEPGGYALTFAQAREHACLVLQQALVADLDTAWRDTVATAFKVGEQRGRAAVATLGEFMHVPPGGVFDELAGAQTGRPGQAGRRPKPKPKLKVKRRR